MNRYTRKLLVGLVAGACMVAFGQANADPQFPADTGSDHTWQQNAPWAPANPNGQPMYLEDMGPLGQWTIGGGIDLIGSVWNNSADQPGTHPKSAGWVTPNAIFMLNGTKGPLRLRVWAGLPPMTPVVGWTGPGLNPNLHQIGVKGQNNENGIGHASTLFKGYVTWTVSDNFSIDLGRIDSVDGTEVGIDWFNPTPMLSPLNNMQTTTADGIQFDFSKGPASLSIRLGDGYNTGQASELGYLGQYNLDDNGDFLIAFGHHRLRTAGRLDYAGHVATFGVVNSNLIGFGGMWNFHQKYAISPEIEYQWLPKGITGGNITAATAPTTKYSNVAAMINLTDQVNSYWQTALQVSYVKQNGVSSTDPNATTGVDGQPISVTGGESLSNIYGNYLGLGAPAGAGNLGQGSNMLGVQVGGTWMYKNMFVRPFLVFTHLTNYTNGNGWGPNGDKPSQMVGLVEVGWLLGYVERH